MTAPTELLPCPFCGSRNVAQGASRDRISVWCFCGAQGPSVSLPEDSIDPITPIKECHSLWNRRAASGTGAVEALRKLRGLFDAKGYLFCSGDYQTEVMAEVDAALASNKPVEDGWCSMDSAPKDGTKFIAFEGGDVYKCNWLEQDDGEGCISEGWWDHVNQSFENPTGWIPLPAPLAASGESSR